MKNKKLSMLFAVLFLVSVGVSGALAYDITIIPGGTQDVSGQNTIYFDIVFNPDSTGNSFDTYGFNIGYDTSELIWNSGLTTNTPPAPLSAFKPPFESSPGLIENFNGFTFSDAPVLTAPTTLATIAFDVAPGINNPADGLVDIWFDTSVGSFTIDGNNVPVSQITVSGTTPDVYVLPEPVSIILFITGGATFGIGSYWRKRKQKLAA